VIVDNYEDISDYKDKAEWLIVQTAGDIIIEQLHLWNKLNSIPENTGYVGHLVWYEGQETPAIEPQCFILRTSAIDSLEFTPMVKEGPTFIRSTDDVHQGSSPLYVDQLADVKQQQYKFGSWVLEQIIQHGYKVQHFDNSWRFVTPSWDIKNDLTIERFLKKYNWPGLPTRGYCFPNETTNEFAVNFKQLSESDNLDDAQQLLIAIIKGIIKLQHSTTINVLHWDVIPELKSADHIICPANGMMAECLAYKTNATKITFYDINPINIEFKKYLYANWDGEDYINFALNWAKDKNLVIEPKCEHGQILSTRELNTIDQISKNWNYYKALDVEFMHIDLVKNPEQIIDKISKNSLIHTSTILSYYIITHVLHDQNKIDSIRNELTNAINNTNSTWLET
jgi:hypothetical protein